MNLSFNNAYTGFYGQLNESTSSPRIVCWRLGEPGSPFLGRNGAIQWINPSSKESVEALPGTPEGQVFLAGLVWSQTNAPEHIANQLGASITRGQYDDLAVMSENAAGCFMGYDGSVSLWVGLASNDHIFYRIDTSLSWSTNPLDLVLSQNDVDAWALRRCCHGDDAFIYKGESLHRVEQGHLVTFRTDKQAGFIKTSDIVFDWFLPHAQLKSATMTLKAVTQLTQEALQNAVRPLACGQPIGIMVSGGSGSVALLHAMKQVGVNTIAYHIEAQEPEASEYRFARMSCEALDIPLVRIPLSSGPDYLSFNWQFSHPDGHPWVRWFEQIAEQARKDGVTVMVTGAGDDHAFGPELHFSASSILSAKIPWQEKRAMIRGLFATDWNIFDLLRSAWPWPPRQLIGLTHLSGPSQEDTQMRRADFLTPLPLNTQREPDAALLHSPCFAPQSMAIEQTILQPSGIRLYYPYYHRDVQAISLVLPSAYKLMAAASLPRDIARLVSDRIVDKPILRLACHNTLVPQEVVWRTSGVCTQAPIQTFCLTHTQILQEVLGNNSRLAKMGILDTEQLKHVLETPAHIRDNYTTLIACALVEIFLRKAFSEQCKRGGPQWQ